jgi:hypothetical protein
MSLEERLEQAEKLVAEVKAELTAMRAEKATKRNWPERIEVGMCFGREDVRYVLFGKRLASIESGVVWSTSGDPFGGDQSEFNYLGKLDLAIRTDAHEPTGAVVVAEPTPDEWREIAAKAISADLVDFLSGAAAYGLWLRGKIPQAIPADRVMADGMVGVDREAIKTAIGLVRCLVVGPGSGQAALSAMESALRSAKGETTP